jgi:hypothetical protein
MGLAVHRIALLSTLDGHLFRRMVGSFRVAHLNLHDSEKQDRAAMDRRNVVYFLDFGPFPHARALVEGGMVFFSRDLSGRILATVSGERYRHGNWIAAGLERYDRINRGPDCTCLHHGVSSRYHKITSTSTFRIRRTASRLLPSRKRDPQSPLPSLPFPATATVHP